MRGPRRLALVVAAAVVATAAGVVAQGRASFPGGDGNIYFTGYDRNVGPPMHLYSVHTDGSDLEQLTSGPADDETIGVATTRAAPSSRRRPSRSRWERRRLRPGFWPRPCSRRTGS